METIETRRGRGLSGFTLMELLTVMAIMFILMGIALTAYYGVLRSSAIQGAKDNLHKTLALSRQHAMTRRMRVYVFFQQESASSFMTNASYRAVAQAGTHAGEDGEAILKVQAVRWEAGSLAGGEIYNMSDGSRAEITGNTESTVSGVLEGGTRNTWDYGDRYGWVIHDAEYLPTTLMFVDGSGSPSLPDTIVFLPDGTTARKGAGNYEIFVKEIQGPSEFKFEVHGLTGLVEAPQE